MPLVVTNTLTGQKEPFTPLSPPQVGMYVCGLTPYEEAHIGHARAYVAYDVMRRWLEHQGHRVTHIQNVTDVDDRIIARAAEKGQHPLDYAAHVHDKSLDAFDRLRIRRAHHYPKVSEHIDGIIAMTQTLIERGNAYAGQDEHGTSVYFSVESDPDYGKLSHLNRDEMLQGVRKEVAEGKRLAADFALWKASKPNEGVSWDSPWGRGRPGWHIECSVMAKSLLGETLDIHGGGWDLIFPHHENELAQSESANGVPFVKYWLHVGFLTVEGVKMSKSLGNFTTLNDALRDWPAEALRLWFAGTHYRSPIDYSLAALAQAAKNVERFSNMLANAKHALQAPTKTQADDEDAQFLKALEGHRAAFAAAMDDDLNTPVALATLFDMTTEINKNAGRVTSATLQKGLDEFHRLAAIFDVLPEEKGDAAEAAPLLDLLLEVRQMARQAKQFAMGDRIRDRLSELGYVIEDTATGPRARRK